MSPMDDLKQQAQDFIRQLAEGDYASAGRFFDQQSDSGYSQKTGSKKPGFKSSARSAPSKRYLACQAAERQENWIVAVSCQFEKALSTSTWFLTKAAKSPG